MVVELSIVAQKKAKKRRGERARKRQRSRSGPLDLRDHYREGDLPTNNLAVIDFEDAYGQAGWIDAQGNLDVSARLRSVRHADGSIAEGAPAWEPPRKPRVRAAFSLRGDVLGRMWARHQIGESQFQGGRTYQECHDAAIIGHMQSVDLAKTKVSGGLMAEPLTDRQRKAAAKLRKIEAQLHQRNGDTGVWLARAVLGERHSPEAAARMLGATAAAEIRSWCWLFRQCLTTIAVATGFISSARRPYRPVFTDGHDPAEDLGRNAVDGELVDPALRRGRANRS